MYERLKQGQSLTPEMIATSNAKEAFELKWDSTAKPSEEWVAGAQGADAANHKQQSKHAS